MLSMTLRLVVLSECCFFFFFIRGYELAATAVEFETLHCDVQYMLI